jgi:hypothetical protein
MAARPEATAVRIGQYRLSKTLGIGSFGKVKRESPCEDNRRGQPAPHAARTRRFHAWRCRNVAARVLLPGCFWQYTPLRGGSAATSLDGIIAWVISYASAA